MVSARGQPCAAAIRESCETRKGLAGRVRSREARRGGEDGLAARRAGVVARHGPGVALGVDLVEAEVLGEGLVEQIGVLARARIQVGRVVLVRQAILARGVLLSREVIGRDIFNVPRTPRGLGVRSRASAGAPLRPPPQHRSRRCGATSLRIVTIRRRRQRTAPLTL